MSVETDARPATDPSIIRVDNSSPLKIVDGLSLSEELRAVYKPGEVLLDRDGVERTLPRYFFEIPDWTTALETRLTAHFDLWEFMICDYREHPVAAEWPRYVPCAITLVAAALEVVRHPINTYIHIAANGGYRSPSHKLSTHASPHCWGTAANIYRIGDEYLEEQERIERYAHLVQKAHKGIWVRPFGHAKGYSDDHLHIDLRYTIYNP